MYVCMTSHKVVFNILRSLYNYKNLKRDRENPYISFSITASFILCKGKGLPRTGHGGPEREQMYSSTLPSTSGGGWSTPRPGRFTPWKDPVPIVQEAGWAPGSVWTGAENLAPTGIRSPDRPARSESLYYCTSSNVRHSEM